MHTDFVLNALEQALYAHARWDIDPPFDKGPPYVSIRYAERLAEAGIEPSTGSAGDA